MDKKIIYLKKVIFEKKDPKIMNVKMTMLITPGKKDRLLKEKRDKERIRGRERGK